MRAVTTFNPLLLIVYCRLLPRYCRSGGPSFINLSVFVHEVEAEEMGRRRDHIKHSNEILGTTLLLM